MEFAEKKKDCKIYGYKKGFLGIFFSTNDGEHHTVFRFHGKHLKE